MSECACDVFVSYSAADRAWVRDQLLPRLERAGLKVRVDYRDFEIGVPRLVNVERAVDDSRHTLIVLTPEWVAGEWNAFEGLLVGTADPSARRRKLIPLMLRPCTLPRRIAMLTYADFTTPEEREGQWERLIGALSKIDVRAHGRAPVPPCAPTTGPPEFVNRERELDQLDVERLRASRSPYTLIGAPAGYGKTYLLRRALYIAEADGWTRDRWSFRYVEFGLEEGDAIAYLVQSITGEPAQGEPAALLDHVCDHIVHELAAPLADGRRAVLLVFDALERLEEQTGRLYTLLCKVYRRTRSGPPEAIVVRTVLAGREVERFWQGYEGACPALPVPQRIRLSPFDEHAIQDWIWSQARALHIVLDDRTVAHITEHVDYLSGGHPRVIHGLVEDLAGRLFLIGSVAQYFAQQRPRLMRTCLAPVADDLLGGLAKADRKAVQSLSVFRRVNVNTVQALVEAGVLPAGTDEVRLLGDMQRAHVLDGPSIGEPFYRDRLMRRVLALNLAHRSTRSRSMYRRLNRVARDLYANWVRDLGKALPDSHLKSTQRLLSVVEWLFHALQDEGMSEDALRSGLQGHIAVLSGGGWLPSVASLISDEIARDAEVCYLLRGRLGEDGVAAARRWLQSP